LLLRDSNITAIGDKLRGIVDFENCSVQWNDIVPLVVAGHTITHRLSRHLMKTKNKRIAMFRVQATFAAALGALCLMRAVPAQSPPQPDNALRAFEVVRSVLQHPRCQNCHVPGDAPTQGEDSVEHNQHVVRGPTGHGAVANECSSCHLDQNLPLTYGVNAPPGSPDWHLPPPETKMVFSGLSARDLCTVIKDRRTTGGKDLAAMMEHIRDNRQVAWGWAPGGLRTLPPATRAETVTAFKTWMDGGAPCPM
jgi:hypothetical protein